MCLFSQLQCCYLFIMQLSAFEIIIKSTFQLNTFGNLSYKVAIICAFFSYPLSPKSVYLIKKLNYLYRKNLFFCFWCCNKLRKCVIIFLCETACVCVSVPVTMLPPSHSAVFWTWNNNQDYILTNIFRDLFYISPEVAYFSCFFWLPSTP